jgi:PAS domain S-box-containing protein
MADSRPENQEANALAKRQRACDELEQKVQERTAVLRQANADLQAELAARTRAAEQARAAEATFRLCIEHHPAAVAMFDREMRYLAVSPRWLQDYGLTGEVIGRSHYELFPEIPARWKEIHQRCLAGATERADEDRFDRADGSVDWVKWEARPWFDLAGAVGGIIIYAENITERKRAEIALQQSKVRLAGVIDSAMDAIISVNEEHRIVLFNHAAETMFGYAASEMLGQTLTPLLPDRFRASHDEHIRQFGLTGTTTRTMGAMGAISGVRRDGTEFPIEASISQIKTDGAKLFTVILRDITRRKAAEEQIREQAALLNHAQEAILVIDAQGQVIFWNPGAEQMYGWTRAEVLGRNINEWIFRDQQAQRKEARRIFFATGEWAGEMRQFTKDGRAITVESHCTLVRDENGRHKATLIINTDITEKKQLEAQFLRAQRLEGIGTLAGGIAHDLNNILAPLTMGVQMLQTRHPDEFSQKMLDVMKTNLERGAAMIQQILSFARGTTGQHVVVQAQHLLKELVKLMRETFPKEITIQQQISPNLWLVEGDPTQLHQVLMNLCVNARDAMPEGGKLTLAAENQTLDELSARMLPGAQAGNFVVITVTDTGTGIAGEHLDHIFDPFFTTKEPGQGTGLGLATVYGIVKAHGGFINVYSEPGHGTQFKIYLPAQATTQSNLTKESDLTATPVGHGELILVVDDEAAIRAMTRASLEAFGYRVLTASDGVEAIRLYAQHKDDVRLVVTDMMMPLMDGPTMIRTLQKMNPQVVVLGSSGLSETGKATEARALGVKEILTKPYNAETLLRTVAQMLKQ